MLLVLLYIEFRLENVVLESDARKQNSNPFNQILWGILFNETGRHKEDLAERFSEDFFLPIFVSSIHWMIVYLRFYHTCYYNLMEDFDFAEDKIPCAHHIGTICIVSSFSWVMSNKQKWRKQYLCPSFFTLIAFVSL